MTHPDFILRAMRGWKEKVRGFTVSLGLAVTETQLLEVVAERAAFTSLKSSRSVGHLETTESKRVGFLFCFGWVCSCLHIWMPYG